MARPDMFGDVSITRVIQVSDTTPAKVLEVRNPSSSSVSFSIRAFERDKAVLYLAFTNSRFLGLRLRRRARLLSVSGPLSRAQASRKERIAWQVSEYRPTLLPVAAHFSKGSNAHLSKEMLGM
jgi:hypothetical protein